MIAIAEAVPAAIAAPYPRRKLRPHASVHIAAAGTSLIGITEYTSVTGLTARSRAAVSPATSPAARLAIVYTHHTIRPASTGATTYAAHPPNRLSAAAIRTGYPNGYQFTSVPVMTPGR